MLINFIKTALRNIKREKTYSVINIFGLSIGLTCFVLFYFSWQYEHSFDKFHKNAENIYRVNGKMSFAGKEIDNQFYNKNVSEVLAGEVPEVQAAAGMLIEEEASIIMGGQRFKENIVLADVNIFRVFTIPIIKEQSANSLQNPQAVLVSESMAKKYFGSTDPIGKSIVIRCHQWEGDEQFFIAGITRDLPSSSSYKMDIVCSSKKFSDISVLTFVRLKDSALLADAGKKIKNIMKFRYSSDPYFKIDPDKFELLGLVDNHLSDPAINKYLSIFGIVSLFVLLLSCVNYINLSISMSIKRIKEIGVRKTLGSGKVNLVWQFLSESLTINILALLLATLFIYALVSILPADILRPVKISEIGIMKLIGGIFCIVIIVSLISGAYPAFYVSRFNPSEIFKNFKVKGQKRFALRKALIFFQFAVLIILLVLTTGISSQLNYIEKSKLGIEKDNIVLVEGLDISILTDTRTEEFRSKMMGNSHIKSVAYLSGHPASFTTQRQVVIQGVTSSDRWIETLAGRGFLNTFGIQLIEGRDFTASDKLRDIPRKVLINEEAAKRLGSGSAIGKTYETVSPYGNKKVPVQVIGVFRNFNQRTLHYQIQPMTISQLPGFADVTAVKIDGRDVQASLNHIKATWNSFFPNVQVTYTFFDEKIQTLYMSEYRLGSMSKIFTLLAVIIAVMGIFGLTAFSTEQRKKEIAIRKVLGATFNKLVITFFKEINLPAVIANIVSLPIGFYLINKWLEEFAYKASIPVIQYIIVIIASLTLAFITVGVQVFRVARANPVNSLRSE